MGAENVRAADGEVGRRWVVVECEWQREVLAIEALRAAGFGTFWVHYKTEIAAHPRNGRKAIPVLRGYYPPWLFVAVDRPLDDVPRIKAQASRYVIGVLWSATDQHYLPEWWLAWIVSGKERIDRETGKVIRPPTCIDPASGLFEPPPGPKGSRTPRFAPGSKVRCTGLWEDFVSIVINDGGASIEVEHGQMFGKSVKRTYLPEQVEPATD
jgi:hypothetical protein